MSEIKSIETYYNGYRFRSRLEARWAVFFDAAGIKYEYEPEGFETNEGTKYLPDFYLPEYDAYVEIKPPRDGIENEIKKAVSCIDNNPGSIRVLLFLSNIPADDDVNIFWFPVAFKHPLSNDIESVRFAFVPSFDNNGLHPGLNYYIGHRCKEFVFPSRFDRDLSNKFAIRFVSAIRDEDMPYDENEQSDRFTVSDLFREKECRDELKRCFSAARQARFEHGEIG